MVMVRESTGLLKGFLQNFGLGDFWNAMALRIVLAFILHRGRMSCSCAAGMIASEPVHRSQVTRFLARSRWKKMNINDPARKQLLALEKRKGAFLILVDGTLVGQAGKLTENTYSTGNRSKRPRKKGSRYNKYKHAKRSCHQFIFCLLIAPSGHRIPYYLPHYTKEYCKEHNLESISTTQAAARLVEQVELPQGAEVYVMGDTAFDSEEFHSICQKKGYYWINPVNTSRVFAGPKGQRPQVRTRLTDWNRLKQKSIKIHPSTSEYASYRRLSRWRIGSKLKPRIYYAHRETREVHSVGKVQLVYSTTMPNLTNATPDEVKILMTNAMHLSLSQIIDLYSIRWQIEIFFKELKSRLGFAQYRFKSFSEVEGWVTLAITAVLFLETLRAKQLARRDLTKAQRLWWSTQRLHGLGEAFIQMTEANELKYISERIKTSGGIAKLKRLLHNTSPKEYRMAA
jgi:hypothetical protein